MNALFRRDGFLSAVFFVGAILFLLGLINQLSFNSVNFAIQETWARIISCISGVVLMAIAFREHKLREGFVAGESKLLNGKTLPEVEPVNLLGPKIGKTGISINRRPFTKGISEFRAEMNADILMVDFKNEGRNGTTWSGIGFRFTSTFDVQSYGHLAIVATSRKEAKFCIEYKVDRDDKEDPELKVRSDYYVFPATMQARVIQIPMIYIGKIDEIAVVFYDNPQESTISITSFLLTE